MLYFQEKVHICELCRKAFHQKSTLKTHALIHSDTRPFSCSHCTMTFRQRSNVVVHLVRKHGYRQPDSNLSSQPTSITVSLVEDSLRMGDASIRPGYKHARTDCTKDGRSANVCNRQIDIRSEHVDTGKIEGAVTQICTNACQVDYYTSSVGTAHIDSCQKKTDTWHGSAAKCTTSIGTTVPSAACTTVSKATCTSLVNTCTRPSTKEYARQVDRNGSRPANPDCSGVTAVASKSNPTEKTVEAGDKSINGDEDYTGDDFSFVDNLTFWQGETPLQPLETCADVESRLQTDNLHTVDHQISAVEKHANWDECPSVNAIFGNILKSCKQTMKCIGGMLPVENLSPLQPRKSRLTRIFPTLNNQQINVPGIKKTKTFYVKLYTPDKTTTDFIWNSNSVLR